MSHELTQLDGDLSLSLWQTFVYRFKPLTKIIHGHSIHPYATRTANAFGSLPRNMQAPLRSIYLVAASTLLEDECRETFRPSKNKSLQRFSSPCRYSINRLDVLDIRNLWALQALFLNLVRHSQSNMLSNSTANR